MTQGFTSFTKITSLACNQPSSRVLPYIALFILGLLSIITGPDRTGWSESPTYQMAHAQIDDGPGIDFIEQEQRYIILFEEDTVANNGISIDDYATTLVGLYGGTLIYTYTTVFEGFAATIAPSAAIDMTTLPGVAEVIEDSEVLPTFFGTRRTHANQTIPHEKQQPAIWNLDRSDQRDRPLDNAYHYKTEASDVHVYVIDSGIRASHQEFEGRLGNGYDLVKDDHGTNDCMGHGTHVAGTIAGKNYGIAKGATLHSVRVFGCSGGSSSATIIAAIDWVTANHQTPAVVNMSLGGRANSAMDKAVERSIAAGLTYVVAAGNNGSDACQISPARVDGALTVGATTEEDVPASFSNIGSCVDLFAPGEDIQSALHTGDDATDRKRGTSMASPHVAGAAALYLQQYPDHEPATVTQVILNSATLDRLSGIDSDSPNRLLYTLFEQSDPTPPPDTPTPPSPTPPTPTPPGSSIKDATLYVEVPAVKMYLNETYTIQIRVDAGNSAVNGVQINGQLDPRYLQIRNVVRKKEHLPLVLESVQFNAITGTFRYGAGKTNGTVDGTFEVLEIEVEAVAPTEDTAIQFVHNFPAADVSGPSGSVMRAAQDKTNLVIIERDRNDDDDDDGPSDPPSGHRVFLPVIHK